VVADGHWFVFEVSPGVLRTLTGKQFSGASEPAASWPLPDGGRAARCCARAGPGPPRGRHRPVPGRAGYAPGPAPVTSAATDAPGAALPVTRRGYLAVPGQPGRSR
jgi:hypothetical protein